MRKYVIVLILATTMLFALAACGEYNNLESGTEQDAYTITDNIQAYEPVLEYPYMQDVTVSSYNQAPTDAEVEVLYQRAVAAMSWFRWEMMPHDSEDAVVDEDGNTYFRVIVEGVNSFAGLDAYLRAIFTADIVDDLLDFRHPPAMYRDFDGVLFALGASGSWDRTRGGEAHEIIRYTRDHTPNYIVYRVTVDILDEDTFQEVVGTVVYDFILTLVGEKWLFSYFNLVR